MSVSDIKCKDCGSKPELMFHRNLEFDLGSKGIRCPKCLYEIRGYAGSLSLQVEAWEDRNKAENAGEIEKEEVTGDE